VLQYLAEGFAPEEVYRDMVAERRPGGDQVGQPSLEMAIANTMSHITLATGPQGPADILEKPFAAWRVFREGVVARVVERDAESVPADQCRAEGRSAPLVRPSRAGEAARSPSSAPWRSNSSSARKASPYSRCSCPGFSAGPSGPS
jgi:hypothetical protein